MEKELWVGIVDRFGFNGVFLLTEARIHELLDIYVRGEYMFFVEVVPA